MNDDESVSIKIKMPTKLRLMRRMKYGDSFDSALNEMLDALDKHKLDMPLTDNNKDSSNPHTHCVKCGVVWRDTYGGLDEDGLCHDCYRDKEDAKENVVALPPSEPPKTNEEVNNEAK